MTRLSNECLNQLPASVQRPDYERNSITTGIVHLGIGAFYRAHQAVCIDDILRDDPVWGIVGASLRRPDTRDALQPQDGLYTLAVRDASGTHCRVIGSILEVVDANKQNAHLIDVMTQAIVRIVSLTITEKGYCHDPASGQLDEKHPDILHDLSHPNQPKTAPGLIVEALARRRENGIAPFTVLSCDNLPANGKTAARIITRFAHLRDADLGAYVRDQVSFPSTMVDRITPATTNEDRAMVRDVIGCEDAWPIVTEPFTQWVIEDNFPQGRPAFEKAGAQLVDDVEPFELMKLRMLNGAHSTMAYLGYLAGFETVAQTINNQAFYRLIHDLMTKEVAPTLDMPGTDLGAYRDALLDRFANPALQHRTWQIAMDGSQKLPQRLLSIITDRLKTNASFNRLALGVAAWIIYASGTNEKGAAIDVRDPLADRLRALAEQTGNDADKRTNAFLQVKEVFGDELPNHPVFVDSVKTHVKNLMNGGALKCVEALGESDPTS